MQKEIITKSIIKWYQENKRELPFRENKNPYSIWISEMMLQQTQVKTMVPYFNRFINRFPTIESLYEASQDEVLKYWEGLGYYNRAKYIHEAAKAIVEKHNGVFPCEYDEIRELKGIGSYTAGAISSIAFNKTHPAVDGNVMRVLSRVFALWDDISLPKTKRLFEEIVLEMMQFGHPALLTEGLMELGALICKPQNEKCHECPLQDICLAYNNGYHDLPVNKKKTKQKNIHLVSAVIQNDKGKYLLRKRSEKGLLANFWEFIQVEGKSFNDIKDYVENHDGMIIKNAKSLGKMKHVFSHRIWNIKAYEAVFISSPELPSYYGWFTKEDMNKISVITAHKRILDLRDSL